MQKEIFEQPTAIGDTLASLVDASTGRVVLPALPFDLARISRFTCCACGTAYLATAVAKYWFEQIARHPAEIDIASQFPYPDAPTPPAPVGPFAPPSGETI